MTPLDMALHYTARGWPVFPCKTSEPKRKTPLTPRGFYDASRDPNQLRRWWRRWPDALIGLPTGTPTGLVVLDVDTKNGVNGFSTLAAMGYAAEVSQYETGRVKTASGGRHVYFDTGGRAFRCSRGETGLGTGLDVRGDGGYVIAPSPGSGYELIPLDTGTWIDPRQTIATAPLAMAPGWLNVPKPERTVVNGAAVPRSSGLSCYGEAALDSACRNIATASAGSQEETLHRECFSIGTLAAAGGVPEHFAIKCLRYAAQKMRDYDQRRPWRLAEIERKVERSFYAGMNHPREALRG
jgi:hypothetical protein